MGNSDDEYEAFMQRQSNLKLSLLNKLGLGEFLNEGDKLLAKTQEERQGRTPRRRKSVADQLPTRRSTRIQKKPQIAKYKYVRGFLGFPNNSNTKDSSDDTDFSDEDIQKEKVTVLGNHSADNQETVHISTDIFVGILQKEYTEQDCLKVIMNNFKRSSCFENHGTDETDSEDDWTKYEDVLFWISASDDSDSDNSHNSDDVNRKITRPRRRMTRSVRSHDVPELSCDDVTEEMLANIARRSSCKIYDSVKGTTCHQCRQKTVDTKTVCRSGRCVGVRGMFCGICLQRRYGETVADALRNPSWECPVCRGICNCSFCRAREGKNPTGILYPEARQNGYECVADYLKDKDENIRKERTETESYGN